MSSLFAPAKINLALVVGGRRPDGRHELVTVYERVDLADTITLERSDELRVDGFGEDTLVAKALTLLAERAGIDARWHATIEKRIPVAAGLGGGSSDAAAALRLANDSLERPFSSQELRDIAATVGADVPFFLEPGAQLGEGDGTALSPLQLSRDYAVVILVPHGAHKPSTGAAYEAFDARGGSSGFEERRAELLNRLRQVRRSLDLSMLPPNDLASSPLSGELVRRGAFRADVSGAGPALYGLFETEDQARPAAMELEELGRAWVAAPTWYG